MSLETKVIKSRLGLLNLAEELGNVSRACKYLGYSRETFYRYKDLFAEGGKEAFKDMNRRVPNVKNCIEPHIEERVAAFAIEHLNSTESNSFPNSEVHPKSWTKNFWGALQFMYSLFYFFSLPFRRKNC